ncbi:hypothetical protein KKF05_00030 [Patescibacteria group bacterium]|nr:hypothetical protein [Patescibacteria group bacterium]MBU1915895.1 hypothetical protein [Patescibacteria group bacterium]
MDKRLDLMHDCIIALTKTLTDAGLEQFGAVIRYNFLEIEIDMNDVEAHEETARFVETVAMHLQRLNINAIVHRLPDCKNIGNNIHSWSLTVVGSDDSSSLLPIKFRCICNTAGRIRSSLHVILG